MHLDEGDHEDGDRRPAEIHDEAHAVAAEHSRVPAALRNGDRRVDGGGRGEMCARRGEVGGGPCGGPELRRGERADHEGRNGHLEGV